MKTFTKRMSNRSHMAAGKWHKAKGTAKEAWGKLTGNRYARIAGKQEYMLGVLEEKYGQSRQDAQQALADLSTVMDEKKQEMRDIIQTTRGWIDEKRGITPKRTKKKRIVGIAAATTLTAALAYYFGWLRSGQMEPGS